MKKDPLVPVGDAVERIPAPPAKAPEDAVTRDCLDAVELLKHAHPSSIPRIVRIAALFLLVGPANLPMFQQALQGSTLTEIASFMGTSKQAVHQRWARMVKAVPALKRVCNARRRQEDVDDKP